MDSIAPLPGTTSLAALAAGDKPARVADARASIQRPVERARGANGGGNEPKSPQESQEAIRGAIAEFFAENRDIHVELDDPSGKVIFQSVDRQTGEVKRQVPSEEMVRLVAKLRQPVGLVVDSTA